MEEHICATFLPKERWPSVSEESSSGKINFAGRTKERNKEKLERHQVQHIMTSLLHGINANKFIKLSSAPGAQSQAQRIRNRKDLTHTPNLKTVLA
jgi:hypothetical protein